MKRVLPAALLLVACCVSSGSDPEPRRQLGLSAHLIPKRVAAQDKSGQVKWGYVLSLPGEETKRGVDRNAIQSAQALVAYMKAQAVSVRANGIWVITTHPAAYSTEEMADLEELKALCTKQGIPLFVCRGSELPDGWKRFSANWSDLYFADRA